MVGAFIFISSSLVTTYQQYVSYMNVIELQKTMALEGSVNGMPDLAINDLKMDHKINRKNQLLFFGGLIFILAPMFMGGLFDSLFPEMVYFKYLAILIGIIFGVTMIYFAIRKKKVKRVVIPAPLPPAPAPIQQAPAPIQQAPAPIQQAPAPIQQAPAPVQQAPAPVQYQQPAPRPVFRPRPAPTPAPAQAPARVSRPIPAPLPQRPIARSQPIQRQPQRPVERPEIKEIPQRRQIPQRPIRRPAQQAKPELIKKFRPSRDNKKAKMLNAIEKTMEEKLYEINRLKAQQR